MLLSEDFILSDFHFNNENKDDFRRLLMHFRRPSEDFFKYFQNIR